jgi:ABC-type bacteriocin/lantibiotic exporter with double-glycine peptidase domain
MNNSPNLISLLVAIWIHISVRRRRQLIVLLLLMLVVSCIEILNVGSVLPFIAVLIEPERVFNNPFMQQYLVAMGINSPDELLIPISFGFGAITLITNGLRLLLLWFSVRVSNLIGSDLRSDAYKKTLYQPYIVHITRNSSEVFSALGKVSTIVGTLNALFTLISSSIILISIMGALVWINPKIASICFFGFGGLYTLIVYATKNKLRLNGERVSQQATNVHKTIQEGLGGIRDVIIDGLQETYCKIFSNADAQSKRAEGNIAILGSSPRFLMEALSILLLLVFAVFLIQKEDGAYGVLPVLGALGLGAQRMLPVLQAAYSSWTSLQGSRPLLEDALNLLDQSIPIGISESHLYKISLDTSLELKNIRFKYLKDSPNVISEVSLMISKGSRIGFIGKTGSGKSTLLDLIMGLLEPDQGEIIINGKVKINPTNVHSWQKNIAHVSQFIYISDASVEENIAFGVEKEEIDRQRVIWAAKTAQLLDVVEKMPKYFQTLVGERGIRLSGGQRQRLGIARALYKRADLIVFDEATSALDEQTEKSVMDAIQDLDQNITILIIAHRISTLKFCNEIVEIENGAIKRKCKYDEIML